MASANAFTINEITSCHRNRHLPIVKFLSWKVFKNSLFQFLADLRRSAGGDGQSPELDLTRSSSEFGLPPRKRKISQEVDARLGERKKTKKKKQILIKLPPRSTEVTSPNLNLQPEHKSLNGLEENNSAVVTWTWVTWSPEPGHLVT